MSFQAYLDAIEVKTGKTPNELLSEAAAHGYDETTKAGDVTDWLKSSYDLGRGHAMAFVHVLKHGAVISDKHVGTTGVHRDASTVLNLNGRATA